MPSCCWQASDGIIILSFDDDREKGPAENVGTKVSQVCVVNPVQPG